MARPVQKFTEREEALNLSVPMARPVQKFTEREGDINLSGPNAPVQKSREREGDINFPNSRSFIKDLTGEVPRKASPLLRAGSLTQLHKSDGNEGSRRVTAAAVIVIIIFASVVAQQCAHLYILKVQGGYDAKASALATAAQECVAVYVSELRKCCDDHYTKVYEKYYRKQLEFSESKCKTNEKELELTRRELEQCKSAHQKETEHLESQIESRKKKKQLLYMVRQCTGQNRSLREKDSELQEMKQKLREKDNHLHRMEAHLNEMKVRLQQKEMELPTS